jgi:malonyl-CoA decarboxylase
LLKFKSRELPARGQSSRPVSKLGALCRALLSDRDGISGGARATEAIRLYETLDKPSRLEFFDTLIRDFSPSPDDVGRAADAYRADPSVANLNRLQAVVEAPRQELFRRLNLAAGGTRALMDMRTLALAEMPAQPQFESIAADLGHLLASWFNSGFLTLERIDWSSPAAVLEKLIAYEAVHQIQGWTDLRRRLEADRRCYGFFHSALPNEPLIFIEVALTRGMSDRIQPLIDPDAAVGDAQSADNAIFYSITNCQPGLRGVPLGSSLIKQVVEDLRGSLPRLKTFATLSPIPNFRKWLAREHTGEHIDEDTDSTPEKKQRLLSLCAWYLLHAKRDSEPLDPVARFHLRNGARIERINWMGDTSPTGIRQAAGLMANYVYELNDLQHNHETYVSGGPIAASGRVERLARQLDRNKNSNWLTRHFL